MMRVASIFVSLVLFTITGCKIYSFTGASIAPDIKTVTIDLFQNRASIIQPSLSQVFTEKLKDKFTAQTNLSLTTSGGDLHFEGFITDYTSLPVAIQGNEQAALNRLSITVMVKFVNTRNNNQNFESSFTRFSEYDSNRNLATVESELIQDICNQLVDDIFNKAVINW
jgi:hypothetical protein